LQINLLQGHLYITLIFTFALLCKYLHNKSLAENFVRLAYQRIYAPLRNNIYFSVEELNQALWEELEKHNNAPFQQKDHSRTELFEQVEKSELKPLPIQRYDLMEFCQLKVQYNYHIYLKEDKHYYSVPFHYTGKTIMVKYGLRIVEIYHNHKRVAFHQRDRTPYGYSTVREHMPVNHQFVNGWNAERFIRWGNKIGPEPAELIRKILESKQHPEQGYSSCMGILSLAKQYGEKDLIKACRKALDLNCINYRFVSNTLTNKAFAFTTEEILSQIPVHNNIRGRENYN